MALYEIQADMSEKGTGWFTLSFWRMGPEHFRDFLTYFFSWSSNRGCENILRIKRIPDEWGKAKWEFDGLCHFSACY